LVCLKELAGRRSGGGGQFSFAIHVLKERSVINALACLERFLAKMDGDGHLVDTVLIGDVGRQAGVGVGNHCN